MINDLVDLVDDKLIPSFDPFAHGFSFAVGFTEYLDPKIGTLELNYFTYSINKFDKKRLSLKNCSAL